MGRWVVCGDETFGCEVAPLLGAPTARSRVSFGGRCLGGGREDGEVCGVWRSCRVRWSSFMRMTNNGTVFAGCCGVGCVGEWLVWVGGGGAAGFMAGGNGSSGTGSQPK